MAVVFQRGIMSLQPSKPPVEAVIFDMDGVLVDSEVYWQESREDFARAVGKIWKPEDQRQAMGRSTVGWAQLMQERLAIDMPIDDIIADMKARVIAHYEQRLPVLPGALEAVKKAASVYKVALASGSETSIIKLVMERTGLGQTFDVVVYGDTIPRGKPAPDIYLETARRLSVPPEQAVGIEDSANGIRALKAAGMYAIAVPSPAFPLPDEILTLANVALPSLEAFTVDLVRAL
jgi:HAD superfamily hydrolase (TIGR01509 family)